MSSSRKRMKALYRGARQGSTVAGAAGFSLDLLGLCVPFIYPIKIGVSALLGMIFACYACQDSMRHPDEEEREVENHHDLMEIKHEIKEMKAENRMLHHQCGMSPNVSGRPSSHSLFALNKEDYPEAEIAYHPADMKMEDFKKSVNKTREVRL